MDTCPTDIAIEIKEELAMRINNVRTRASSIMLLETFRSVRKQMAADYAALAEENSALQNTKHPCFMFQGEVHPYKMDVQSVYGIPKLHHSLFDKFQQIEESLHINRMSDVKNYFVAALALSNNRIVLERVFPSMLLNLLKKELSPSDYDYLDLGVQKKTDIEVLMEVAKLEQHYASTVTHIKHLLMEKLLLQE